MTFYGVCFIHYSHFVTDYGKVVIGQDIDDNGDVVTGRGMVGELSRFNWWDRNIFSWEREEMFQRCGTEVGEFLAWPQLKYWIVGDVEILEGTTCIKPG